MHILDGTEDGGILVSRNCHSTGTTCVSIVSVSFSSYGLIFILTINILFYAHLFCEQYPEIETQKDFFSRSAARSARNIFGLKI